MKASVSVTDGDDDSSRSFSLHGNGRLALDKNEPRSKQ